MRIFDIINNLGRGDAYTKKYEERANKYRKDDNNYSIDLDYWSEYAAKKDAKKHGLKVSTIAKHGPAAGNPYMKFSGTKGNITKLVKTYARGEVGNNKLDEQTNWHMKHLKREK